MLTIAISTSMFLLLLGLGHLLMFIDETAYLLVPIYLLVLLLMKNSYQENCVTMERKDFVIITLFCGGAFLLYRWLQHSMSFDAFAYLYLCTFLSYISFSSSIRYKSLI